MSFSLGLSVVRRFLWLMRMTGASQTGPCLADCRAELTNWPSLVSPALPSKVNCPLQTVKGGLLVQDFTTLILVFFFQHQPKTKTFLISFRRSSESGDSQNSNCKSRTSAKINHRCLTNGLSHGLSTGEAQALRCCWPGVLSWAFLFHPPPLIICIKGQF